MREQGNLYSLQDILERIHDGRMQSWARGDSWLVTQISSYPQKKVLDVVVGVGDKDDLLSLEQTLISFCKSVGASRIVINGRTGWLKFAKMYDDWHLAGYKYVKEIANGRT